MDIEAFEISTWEGAWRSGEGAFRRIFQALEHLSQRQEAVMASLDDLNAALAQVQTDVQALTNRIAALGSVDVPQGTLDTVTAIDNAVNALAQPAAPQAPA